MHKQKMMTLLTKVDRIVSKVVEVICVILLAAIVVTISVSVFTRFVMFNPLNFTNPLAEYLMIWLAFLGTGLAFRSGEHIAIDMLMDRLRGKYKKLLLILMNTLISIFLIIIIYYGFEFALAGLESHDPLVFGMCLVFPYLSVPISFIYILFQVNMSMTVNLLKEGI